ncbi:TPA: hypothetical protein ACMDWD_003375 [Vibrio cholerae]
MFIFVEGKGMISCSAATELKRSVQKESAITFYFKDPQSQRYFRLGSECDVKSKVLAEWEAIDLFHGFTSFYAMLSNTGSALSELKPISAEMASLFLQKGIEEIVRTSRQGASFESLQ